MATQRVVGDRARSTSTARGSVASVVQQSLALIGREHRGRWIMLVALAVLASLLEMVGAGLVYVLLASLADPGAGVDLPVLGRLVAAGDGDRTGLLTIAGAVAVFFLVRAIVQIGVTHVQHRVAYNAGARLSERLAAGYLRAPYEFHLRRNSAESIRNVNAAAYDVVQRAFLPMIGVAASTILAVGLLAVMSLVSPLATFLAVVVVGGAVGALLRVIQPRLKHLGEVTHWWNRATLRAIKQALEGYRDIRLLGREERFVASYAEGVRRLASAAYSRGTVGALPRLVMETALVAFILLFLVTAVVGGADSEAVVSTLGVFAYAGLRLQPSLNGIVAGINELRYATAVVGDVHADLQAGMTTGEPGELALRRALRSELRLERVSFRYAGVERPALEDVDLTIRAGQRVGICGPTGGGKSTLVDLLIGLLEPTSGRILLDGEDLADDVRGWQRNLGVVSQSIFLTDDTLRRNIAFGLDDDEIDAAALAGAVRLAQLDAFVDQLPDRLDTLVGERGIRVSGGQRQRIAIARALYRDAEVLVLDEGTSALDNVTEAALLAALRELPGPRTTVTVAHRLSTVRDADVLVYVADGRVAGVATYDELLATNAGFRALAESR